MTQSTRFAPGDAPEFDVPNIGLFELIFDNLDDFDVNRLAIDDGVQETTFGELKDHAEDVAKVLNSMGIGRGQRVALHCPNSAEFAGMFLGILKARAVCVFVGTKLTPAEIRRQFADIDVDAVISTSAGQKHLRAAAEGPHNTHVRVMDAADFRGLARLLGPGAGQNLSSEPRGDDVAVIALSSGTTGHPKGVVLSHRNLVANILQTNHTLRSVMDESSRLATPLPFHHIFGTTVLLCHSLYIRASQFTSESFSFPNFLQTIESEQIGTAFVTPSILQAFANEAIVDDFDLSSLHRLISGAAPLSAELAQRVHRRLGCAISQGYGMTETSPVTHINVEESFATGNVGRPVIGTEVLIAQDPRGNCGLAEHYVDGLSRGGSPISPAGEVWIRGPQVMVGYFGDRQATEASFLNGWLRTGDLGVIDSSGRLYILDRLKNIINYKGYQISPVELENTLQSLTNVDDAAVVGITRESDSEEIPVAFVVLASGSTATAAEIMDAANRLLASYKRIRKLHLLPEIPKSSSGKSDRKKLLDTIQIPLI